MRPQEGERDLSGGEVLGLEGFEEEFRVAPAGCLQGQAGRGHAGRGRSLCLPLTRPPVGASWGSSPREAGDFGPISELRKLRPRAAGQVTAAHTATGAGSHAQSWAAGRGPSPAEPGAGGRAEAQAVSARPPVSGELHVRPPQPLLPPGRRGAHALPPAGVQRPQRLHRQVLHRLLQQQERPHDGACPWPRPHRPVHPASAPGARDRPPGRAPAPPGRGPHCTRSGKGLLSPTTQALCARGEGARAACWQASSPPSSPSFPMRGAAWRPLPPEPPGLPRSREMLGRKGWPPSLGRPRKPDPAPPLLAGE